MRKLPQILRAILLIAQAITSGLALFALFQLNILQIWQFALIALVLVALLALSLWQLILRKKSHLATQILCIILSVLCIIAGIVTFYYVNSLNRFIGEVTDSSEETREYSVLVLSSSSYQQIDEVANQPLGLLETDPYVVNAEQALREKISFTPHLYPDVAELIAALNDTSTTAVVLESSRLEALSEDAHELVAETRVIYTFTIIITEENAAQATELTTQPFLVYISGTDSRTGINTAARSDVNIIAVVNPAQAKILLISIPRDYYVQLHGTTGLPDKLTHAGIYGINMSKSTLEDLLGANINYTVKVSFETLIRVVDQIDGINITSDLAMNLQAEDGTPCNFIAGTQHVGGTCALRFARERKSYATGDRHRGQNQQQVITSIISKLTSSKTYLLRYPAILSAAAGSFETSFTYDEITSFARHQLATGVSWQVESISLDGTGAMLPTYSMGTNLPLYVMLPDQSTIAAAQAKISAYLAE